MLKVRIFRFFIHIVACMMLLMTISSCYSTRYLENHQSLLKKTKIVYKNEKDRSVKKTLTTELTSFIEQKPNEKFLFLFPREWFYLVNSGPDKDKWYNKGLKSLGDPPVIYDEKIAKKIAANMENHLKFKKGFYEAKVDFIVDEHKAIKGWANSYGNDVWESNTADVTYIVYPGDRYKVSSINYESQDKPLLSFVESIRQDAFIKAGDPIDFTKFELEKSRITIELQNHGYSNFSNNYIEISGDSSRTNKSIDIFVQINTPLPDTVHARYITGQIKVFTDYYKDQVPEILTEDTLNGFSFFRQSRQHLVKPSLIYQSVFFKEGELLRRDDRQKTFRKLNSLGTYRFVTINAVPDKSVDSVMNFEILLTPFNKKWIYDGGMQGYFSTLGAARLFGFSLSSQFVNRNLLGGSEQYTLKAEAGTELGYSAETGIIRRTTNLSFQNNLNIPSFQDFLGLGRLVNKTGIIKNKFYKNFVEEASTNIGIGFNAVNIISFYSLTSFNASFGFNYTSPKNNRYVFRPLGFNLDLYEIKDSSRFAQNPLIKLSFKDILGTGFLFRDFSYIYNKAKDKKGNSFLAINNFEASGWEVFFVNQLYNAISGTDDVWTIKRSNKENIAFAKYLRYEFDGRYSKEITPTRNFASRLNFGIIVPFGNNAVSPFIRQFGVGGPNSLRAWNIKEPGPGSYRDPLSKLKEIPVIFVNQGDLKLEMNLEYRFKLLLLLDGAFFIDAGNVWTLKDDPERPGAAITTKFYEQLAIGAGYGIRFNFGFFIIRLDCGYKVRSPYADVYKSSQWYSLKEIRQQGLGNVQVAVNYPF